MPTWIRMGILTTSLPAQYASIWGSPDGPDTTNFTMLENGMEACFVADFDKDGYLDLAFDFANEDYGGIYWGTSNGYSETNLSILPTLMAQHNIESADLNKDGWLDLVFVNQMGSANYIYWGFRIRFPILKSNTTPLLEQLHPRMLYSRSGYRHPYPPLFRVEYPVLYLKFRDVGSGHLRHSRLPRAQPDARESLCWTLLAYLGRLRRGWCYVAPRGLLRSPENSRR